MESTAPTAGARWELYRLLAEPVRLRLLALAADEELAIGELAELLREGQPNVSRHVAPLRKAGLLAVRKHGTRVLVRLAESAESDPVVADGVEVGRALCKADGSLARMAEVLAQRDENARAFFASSSGASSDPGQLPEELPAYLTALSLLIGQRTLAVDAGCGSGPVLDLLAPVFKEVIAVDREQVQLALAALRLKRRGYGNVTLLCEHFDSPRVRELVEERGGADVVFASRVLHHAPKPSSAIESLAGLLRPGGALLVVDYAPHENDELREQQADLWLGFSREELVSFARRAGLVEASVQPIGSGLCGSGADSNVAWQCMIARRARVHSLNAHKAGSQGRR